MQAEHQESRNIAIARNGMQAIVWAFGVAAVVSVVLAAVVVAIASAADPDGLSRTKTVPGAVQRPS